MSSLISKYEEATYNLDLAIDNYLSTKGSVPSAILQMRSDLATILNSLTNSPALASKNYQSLNSTSQGVVKPSFGKLLALTAHNKTGATVWFQIYNKNSFPSKADTPQETHPIFPNHYLILDTGYFGEFGSVFDRGITFAVSSSNSQYVETETKDLDVHIKYI